MKYRMWAAMLAVYIIWGSTYLAIRFAVETIPPFLMAGSRFLIAGLILYSWRRWLSRDRAPSWPEWRSAGIVGLFLLFGGNGLVVWAEQRVVSSVAALMIGLVPLWIVVVDAFIPGSPRPARRIVAGVLLGFAGIILLVGPAQWATDELHIDLVGVAALLLASLSWAIGSVYARDAVLNKSPLLTTGMEMLAGGAALVILATISGEWTELDLSAITMQSAASFIYLILFGALVAFTAYAWLLRVAPLTLVSTYAYVNPLVAVLLGSLFAQEPLNARIMLSALVIVSSVVLINTARLAAFRPSKPA